MQQIEHSINEYMEALTGSHGNNYRDQTNVRHTGGSDVVIEYPEGSKAIVSIGRLRLMTKHLRTQAEFKKAA